MVAGMPKALSVIAGIIAGALGGAITVALIAFTLYRPGPESWDYATPILILGAAAVAAVFGGATGAAAGLQLAEGNPRRAALIFGGAMAAVSVLTFAAAVALWVFVRIPQRGPSTVDKREWVRTRGPLDPQGGVALAGQLLDCHARSRGLTPDGLAHRGCKSELAYLIDHSRTSYDSFDNGWRWESVKTPRGYKVVVRPDPLLEQRGPVFEFDDDRLLVKRADANAPAYAVETPLPAIEPYRQCLAASGPDQCRHLETNRGPSQKHVYGPGESFSIRLADADASPFEIRLFPRGRYEEGRFELHVQARGRRYMFLQGDDWHAAAVTQGSFAYEKNPPPAACERDIRVPCASENEKLAQDTREWLYDRIATRIRFALSGEVRERVLVRFDPETMPGLERAVERDLRLQRVELLPYGPVDNFDERLDQVTAYIWLPTKIATPEEQYASLARWTGRGGRRREIHVHWMEGTLDFDGRPAVHPQGMDQRYLAASEVHILDLMWSMDRVISALKTGEVRVSTSAGTDIRFRLGDRPVNRQLASSSDVDKARMRIDRHIEIPPGVLRVAPVETSVNGSIVFPRFRIREGVYAHDVRLTFTSGRITRATASSGQAELDNYFRAQPALTQFREFCLGMNPELALRPDDRVIPYYGYGAGVVRMSFGDNEELGGDVRGGAVRWNFFTDATVTVGDQVLVRSGRLMQD
jgi:hypothetical protein